MYSGLGEDKLIHELIPYSTPNKNAHIESFHSIVEIEVLYPGYFKNYSHAYEQTVDFMLFYNKKRIHGSLNFKTPKEIFDSYLNGNGFIVKPVRV